MIGRTPSQAGRPRVLLCDADGQNAEWFKRCLAGYYDVFVATHAAQALHAFDTFHPHVVVGGTLADASGAQFLAWANERGLLTPGAVVSLLLGAQDESVLEDTGISVFYVLNRSMSDNDARSIVSRAFATLSREPTAVHMRVHSPADAARMQRVLEVSRRLAVERDLKDAARTIIAAVTEFVQADRAYCVYHDAKAGSLWIENPDDDGSGEQEARPVGIAGFTARTGTQVYVDRVDEDPRYFRRIDDPAGRGDEQLIAQPVAAPGGGPIHAVLVAIRQRGRPPFSLDDRETLLILAENIGPLIHYLALQVESESMLEDQNKEDDKIFRVEALEAHSLRRADGDVVRVNPTWVSYCYPILLACLVLGGALASLFKITEYSSGPAYVDLGVTEVSADATGIVTAVRVKSGDVVRQGDVLANFYASSQAAQYAQTVAEWESQLANYLQNPADRAAGRTVASLQRQKQLIEANLAIRAPHSGVVSSVFVARGEEMQQGQAALVLRRGNHTPQVVALMPGRDLPLLRPGMEMRISFPGLRNAYQELVVASVDHTIVGPNEAKRMLGGRGDVLQIGQPVVIVRANLPSLEFQADGADYNFHDGMTAFAEVRVRQTRLITTIVPGLDKL